MTLIKYTEVELVTAIQCRSKDGFDYLYKNYSSTLYGIVVKIVKNEEDAHDILQDVFVKIWKNIHQYNPALSRFFTWMSKIARNLSIDFLRTTYCHNKAKTGEFKTGFKELSGVSETSVDVIGISKITDKLDANYRVLIDLAFYSDLTYEEIGKHLDIPLGTVKTRIRKALQMIRKEFSYQNAAVAQ